MTINRECGDCNACCIWLKGESYSHEFGGGKPCHFLKGNCSIYETRPEVCKTYQCAWLQGLFSENLKPEKSKVIISVENWSKGQFLRAIEMGKKMDDNVHMDTNPIHISVWRTYKTNLPKSSLLSYNNNKDNYEIIRHYNKDNYETIRHYNEDKHEDQYWRWTKKI